MKDILRQYNEAFHKNLPIEKKGLLSSFSKKPGHNILHNIQIISGERSTEDSFLNNSNCKIYQIKLSIKKKEYSFFKKIIQNKEEEIIISRWRYISNNQLELPIESFFYTEFNLSRKDAKFCEKHFEEFPFINFITEYSHLKERSE